MQVVYGGCRWNTLVFRLCGNVEFANWLDEAHDIFQQEILKDPAKFKVTSRRGPTFHPPLTLSDQPSNNEDPLLRCRLSTMRDVHGEPVPNAVIMDRDNLPVFPEHVWANAFMTPIIRLGYSKNGDDFGLTLTVLKADYVAPLMKARPDNDDWIMDTDSNTTGPLSPPSSPSSPS